MKSYWVYMLASDQNGTLYIGVTGDLPRRIYIHKQKIKDGFTKRYDVIKLVYAEAYNNPYDAITREKRLKKWNREWKLRLIEGANPEWNDLYDSLVLL